MVIARSRRRFWLIAGTAVMLFWGFAAWAAWRWLPEYFPEGTVAWSPFPDPVVRAHNRLLLDGGDPSPARERIIEGFGTGATGPLSEHLEHQDDDLRLAVAQMIAEIGDDSPDHVPALVAALDDRHPGVRIAAVRALVAIGDPALPALEEAAASEDVIASYNAENAIYEIRE